MSQITTFQLYKDYFEELSVLSIPIRSFVYGELPRLQAEANNRTEADHPILWVQVPRAYPRERSQVWFNGAMEVLIHVDKDDPDAQDDAVNQAFTIIRELYARMLSDSEGPNAPFTIDQANIQFFPVSNFDSDNLWGCRMEFTIYAHADICVTSDLWADLAEEGEGDG